MAVKIENGAFSLNGRRIPFLSGSLHYWRLSPSTWPVALDHMKEAGLAIVCTVIPWSIHELEKGRYDFGETSKEKDLSRFLELAAERELYVIARPGPHINAELTCFGFPRRLLYREELLSRSATGTPVFLPAPFRAFPIPSYAAEPFYEELHVYFKALAPILKAHLYPKGPIIALQCDNEMSMFFRVQPFDHDYSPASLKLYRRYLEEKYGSLDEIRKAHRLEYPALERIKPPRQFNAENYRQLRRYLDWVEYKEYYIAYALKRIKAMWEELGVKDVAFTHNFPTPFPQPPYDIRKMEKIVDVQGVDAYLTKEQYHLLKKGCLFVSTESRLPCFPEFSSGFAGMTPLITLEDQKFTTRASLMHGMKGVNFYMFVERERWYGSPVSRRGRKREEYWQFCTEIIQQLKTLWRQPYHRVSHVLLILPRLYHYLELATSLISPIPVELMDLLIRWGPEMWTDERDLQLSPPPQIYFHAYWNAFYELLHHLHVPFSLASEEISEKELCSFRVAILPTFACVEKSAFRRLLLFAEKGGTLITGPAVPEMDQNFNVIDPFSFPFPKPLGRAERANIGDLTIEQVQFFDVHPKRSLLRTAEGNTVSFQLKLKKGKIVHLGGVPAKSSRLSGTLIEWLSQLLKAAGVASSFALNNDELDMSLHKGENEDLLFIANPTEKVQRGKLFFKGKKAFAPWDEKEFTLSENFLPLDLSAFSILTLRVKDGL